LLVALVMGVVVGVRVWRRPRERGKLFCRGCNYKLVPPMVARDKELGVTVAAGARCPECGVELEKRGPVIGRARWERLWPVWAVSVPGVVVCVVVLAMTLEWKTTWHVTWPVYGAEKVMGQWAVQKRDWNMRRPVRYDRLMTRWKLPEGTRMGAPWEVRGESSYVNGKMTPDGRAIVSVVMGNGGVTGQLEVMDAVTGERRVGVSPSGSYASVVGFTKDGKGAYVQVGVGGPRGGVVELAVVDLATLEERVIATVGEKRAVAPPNVGQVNANFLVDESGERMRWVAQVSGWGADGSLGPITVVYFDGAERREYAVPKPAGARSWYGPRLLDGGKSLEVTYYNGTGGASFKVDLETGVVTPMAAASFTTVLGGSANGRYRVDRGSGTADVVEVSSGRVVGKLVQANGSAVGGMMTVSDDGRWAAGLVWNQGGWGMPRAEVGVWGLESGK
jgi:hypothetical protein